MGFADGLATNEPLIQRLIQVLIVFVNSLNSMLTVDLQQLRLAQNPLSTCLIQLHALFTFFAGAMMFDLYEQSIVFLGLIVQVLLDHVAFLSVSVHFCPNFRELK